MFFFDGYGYTRIEGGILHLFGATCSRQRIGARTLAFAALALVVFGAIECVPKNPCSNKKGKKILKGLNLLN